MGVKKALGSDQGEIPGGRWKITKKLKEKDYFWKKRWSFVFKVA